MSVKYTRNTRKGVYVKQKKGEIMKKEQEIIRGCKLSAYVMPINDHLGAYLRVCLEHEVTGKMDCSEISFNDFARDEWGVLDDICLEFDNGDEVYFGEFSDDAISECMNQHYNEFVDAHRKFLKSTFKWDYVKTDRERKLVNFLLKEINFFKHDVDQHNFLEWFFEGAEALECHDYYEMAKSETWAGHTKVFDYDEEVVQ
jgi:hypothetical protein